MTAPSVTPKPSPASLAAFALLGFASMSAALGLLYLGWRRWK